jgi:hypothetical protein
LDKKVKLYLQENLVMGRWTMNFNMHFSLIPTIIVVIILILIYQKRSSNEDYLGLKLLGYYLLGGFNFNLIPVGFVIFLVLFHPQYNKIAKRNAAICGLIFIILSQLFPILR